MLRLLQFNNRVALSPCNRRSFAEEREFRAEVIHPKQCKYVALIERALAPRVQKQDVAIEARDDGSGHVRALSK